MKFESFPSTSKLEQKSEPETRRPFHLLMAEEGEQLKKLANSNENDKSALAFIKAFRIITTAIALMGITPTTAYAESSTQYNNYSGIDLKLSETETANRKTEENIENFNVPGLSIGKVKNLERGVNSRGIHYQKGLYQHKKHLGDISYPNGRVVDGQFFIERVYQILKANGLKNFD
ncbi:hypothetical protein K9M47_00900 [Candidatus Gracilibacteria bacterium]|nr:hypothetical protein [Candidatus Gracilibacteria bacterium]MCF7898434.1 hypothetical protein [Candidatus Paceibacterota bacterium]